jgi:hypothetical protein
MRPRPEQARCWRCNRFVDCKAPILCLECHAREVAKVHAHDTPTTPEVPTEGAYQPPAIRLHRPSSSGKRIIKKAEPLGG